MTSYFGWPSFRRNRVKILLRRKKVRKRDFAANAKSSSSPKEFKRSPRWSTSPKSIRSVANGGFVDRLIDNYHLYFDSCQVVMLTDVSGTKCEPWNARHWHPTPFCHPQELTDEDEVTFCSSKCYVQFTIGKSTIAKTEPNDASGTSSYNSYWQLVSYNWVCSLQPDARSLFAVRHYGPGQRRIQIWVLGHSLVR